MDQFDVRGSDDDSRSDFTCQEVRSGDELRAIFEELFENFDIAWERTEHDGSYNFLIENMVIHVHIDQGAPAIQLTTGVRIDVTHQVEGLIIANECNKRASAARFEFEDRIVSATTNNNATYFVPGAILQLLFGLQKDVKSIAGQIPEHALGTPTSGSRLNHNRSPPPSLTFVGTRRTN